MSTQMADSCKIMALSQFLRIPMTSLLAVYYVVLEISWSFCRCWYFDSVDNRRTYINKLWLNQTYCFVLLNCFKAPNETIYFKSISAPCCCKSTTSDCSQASPPYIQLPFPKDWTCSLPQSATIHSGETIKLAGTQGFKISHVKLRRDTYMWGLNPMWPIETFDLFWLSKDYKQHTSGHIISW